MDDRGCRLIWLMLLILVPTAGANGQRLDSPAPARESLTLEIIASRQAQAEATPDLEDEPRQRIAQLYTSATGHIERCESLKTRQAELSTSRENIADRLAKTQNQIQEVDSSEPDPLAQSTRNYLEQETLRRQLRLDELRQKLAGIEEQVTSRPARRQEIRSRLAVAEEELESLNREIDADTPTAEPPLLTLAKRTNLVALLQQLEVEMPALREELALYDAEDIVEFLRFQRDLVTRQVALAEGELELVAKATTRVREQTAQEAIEKTRHDAAEVDPAFTKLAERNNELAQLNGQVLQQVAAAEKERDRIESQYTKLNSEFKLCQDRVKNVVGLPASLGAVLRKQRSEMPSIRGHVREIKKRQQLVDEAQLARLDLEEQHSRLTQIKTEVEQVISHNPKIPDDAKALLKSQASDLFSRQQELLESLVRAESSYFDALSTTSLKQQQLVETCRQFSNFIDERVLWIRSDPSLFSKSCWQELSGEKLPFDQLAEFAKLLREDVKNKTVWYLALGTLGLIVLRAGMTLKQVLAKLGDKARRGSFTEFYPTIQATLITFTLALPVPLLVGFLAWRLRSVAGDDANLPSILAGLLTFAAAFVPFELARQICRPDGLADAHFQWPATAVRILRSWLRVLVIVIPILGMTVAMLSFQSQPDSGPSARRLAFIFTVLVYALFLARLLHPGNGVLTEYLNRHQHGWLFRLRYPLHWLAISLPLGLATMAAVGYFYTAEQISIRF
jgi:potassium efflux system protein